MSARRAVLFPPRSLCDFVIHYRSADFHVHQVILHLQSAFFRDFFLTLPQPAAGNYAAHRNGSVAAEQKQPAVPPVVRSSTSPPPASEPQSADASAVSPPSSASPPACQFGHSAPVACIVLNESFGVSAACVDGFELFLHHLYFPAWYRFPPLTPKTRLQLDVVERQVRPASLDFPPPTDSVAVFSYAMMGEEGAVLAEPQLLSLFHSFGCERAWQQCLAVIRLKACSSNAWCWLAELSRYGLHEEEDRLIQQAAMDTAVDNDERYRTLIAALSPSTILRIIRAIHSRRR